MSNDLIASWSLRNSAISRLLAPNYSTFFGDIRHVSRPFTARFLGLGVADEGFLRPRSPSVRVNDRHRSLQSRLECGVCRKGMIPWEWTPHE